jgi:hypothetical protein
MELLIALSESLTQVGEQERFPAYRVLSGSASVTPFISRSSTLGHQPKAADMLMRFSGDIPTVAQLMKMDHEKIQESIDKEACQQQKRIALTKKSEKDGAKNEPSRRSKYQSRKRAGQL